MTETGKPASRFAVIILVVRQAFNHAFSRVLGTKCESIKPAGTVAIVGRVSFLGQSGPEF